MKRLSMFVLALTLVFSLGSVIMAQEVDPLGRGGGGGNWPPATPTIFDEIEFCVEAENPLYGEIEGMPTVCTPLGAFSGEQGSLLSGDFDFSIKSNGFLKVTLNLEDPFTHVTYNDQLPTHAQMQQKGGSQWNPTLTNRATVYHQWPGNKYNESYTMADLVGGQASGRGIRNYLLAIQGKLGDIHEQAAGIYKAKVTVTLAAP